MSFYFTPSICGSFSTPVAFRSYSSIYIYFYVYVYVCVYIYVYVYIYLYVYIYVYGPALSTDRPVY